MNPGKTFSLSAGSIENRGPTGPHNLFPMEHLEHYDKIRCIALHMEDAGANRVRFDKMEGRMVYCGHMSPYRLTATSQIGQDSVEIELSMANYPKARSVAYAATVAITDAREAILEASKVYWKTREIKM